MPRAKDRERPHACAGIADFLVSAPTSGVLAQGHAPYAGVEASAIKTLSPQPLLRDEQAKRYAELRGYGGTRRRHH